MIFFGFDPAACDFKSISQRLNLKGSILRKINGIRFSGKYIVAFPNVEKIASARANVALPTENHMYVFVITCAFLPLFTRVHAPCCHIQPFPTSLLGGNFRENTCFTYI